MENLTILFDLDGVLIDTETQYTRFWQAIGRQYLPQVPTFAEQIKGRILKDIFADFFPHASSETLGDIRRRLSQFEAGMDYLPVPGAKKFVASLRQQGVKTAVVTSSDAIKMNSLYSRCPEFKQSFDKVLIAGDYKHAKPDPDCYLTAAAALGADPCDCVVFEDSLNGLKAALGARMFVVGLSTTLSHAQVAQHSNLVIPNFEHFDLQMLEQARLRASE